ncbi:MAG: Fe-S-containing protein [Bryobacteraceae bacterium]
MLQTFVITLREGVEAALVIAIAVAYLRKIDRMDLFAVVYRAFGTALIASIAVAWLFTRIELNQEAYEGWVQLAAAALVLTMIVWMNRHAKGLKGEIESQLQKRAVSAGAGWGIFLFVFLMIFREGAETVLLLTAVNFDSSGVLEVAGLLLGILLAALFGVSFVRGSFKIDLGRFFRMTTAILTVVVVQLVVTGLHELSEGGVLPSSEAEMALIGPIVRNEVFFVVVILAMAAAMILMEWSRRRPSGLSGLEGAALRKAAWTARRERLWMIGSCTASAVFMLMLTAEFIYATAAAELTPAVPLQAVDGRIRIPLHTFADGNLHRFAVQSGGVSIRLIGIRRPDRSVATAFDACVICGSQGYYQDGPHVMCKNCASAIFIPTIGIAGGCNPAPLPSAVDGGDLVIELDQALDGAKFFR